MRLFLEGEAASGRGSGGSASFPPSVPRHPTSACGARGPVAKRPRVAHGWRGLTGLIQLAGRPQPLRNSSPAGAELGSCSLCDDPMHMDTVPRLWHAPHFWHLRLCSPPPPERRRPWSLWKSWGTVAAGEHNQCGGGSRKGVWKGVHLRFGVSVYLCTVTCRLCCEGRGFCFALQRRRAGVWLGVSVGTWVRGGEAS